jgi:hypothetical protein
VAEVSKDTIVEAMTPRQVERKHEDPFGRIPERVNESLLDEE